MQEKSCSFLFLYDKWDSNEFHWLKMDVRRGRGYLILAVSPVIGFSVVADDVVIIISSSMRKEPESKEKIYMKIHYSVVESTAAVATAASGWQKSHFLLSRVCFSSLIIGTGRQRWTKLMKWRNIKVNTWLEWRFHVCVGAFSFEKSLLLRILSLSSQRPMITIANNNNRLKLHWMTCVAVDVCCICLYLRECRLLL